MRFWQSYGSEHSANLVMIGRFRDEESAIEVERLIELIGNHVASSGEDYYHAERYTEETMNLLKEIGWHNIHPNELNQFMYGISPTRRDGELTIHTDEGDLSAFLKLMVDNGARVEVYSAHIYTNDPATNTES